MRISDWSAVVCSSDLPPGAGAGGMGALRPFPGQQPRLSGHGGADRRGHIGASSDRQRRFHARPDTLPPPAGGGGERSRPAPRGGRSNEGGVGEASGSPGKLELVIAKHKTKTYN